MSATVALWGCCALLVLAFPLLGGIGGTAGAVVAGGVLVTGVVTVVALLVTVWS